MKSSVTIADMKRIYAKAGAEISDADLPEEMDVCNEQADMVRHDVFGKPLPSRTAEEWARFYALQTAEEQNADGIASRQFDYNAYGR